MRAERCSLCGKEIDAGDPDAVQVGDRLAHEEFLHECEPQLEAIRRHRHEHPTASESARARWEGKQKRLHGCDYMEVNGERVCVVHGSAPMKEEAEEPDSDSDSPGRLRRNKTDGRVKRRRK
jgi:hypothetical protein